MNIAGRTLPEWIEHSRRDDCLERMVPSDLRQLVGEIGQLRSDFDALQTALVGKTGLSAIQEAHKLRALHPLTAQ